MYMQVCMSLSLVVILIIWMFSLPVGRLHLNANRVPYAAGYINCATASSYTYSAQCRLPRMHTIICHLVPDLRATCHELLSLRLDEII